MNQILEQQSYNEIGRKLESSEFVKNYLKDKKQFIPHIDYSTASNFVHYGLAEKYYEDSIKKIYKTFPYDGSQAEKQEWLYKSTPLDKFIYNNLYPRTNGYISLGLNWGSVVGSSDGYGEPSALEYIHFKGGPNIGFDISGERRPQTKIKNIFENANVYDETKKRQSNLEYNLPGYFSGSDNGITIEFWLKKNGFASGSTSKEVLFDLWNGKSTSSSEYGRLTLEMDATASNGVFRVTCQSGSSGFQDIELGSNATTSSVSDNTWKHYAFSFHQNTNNEIETKLYINGVLDDSYTKSLTSLTAFGKITGSLQANIGSLVTTPKGLTSPQLGWGKLVSSSLDEFRYWKVKRSEEEIQRFYNTQVGGGVNTDDETTKLGVYYKFNEGITLTSSVDSLVLDYSGRVTNGTWVGYESGSRSTNSAIIESSASIKEYKDPIVYSFHPSVNSFLQEMMLTGSEYDYINQASIWNSLPSWMRDEDSSENEGNLKNLTQILASEFDNLYLYIEFLTKYKNIEYVGDKNFQKPFAKQLLEHFGFKTYEIFSSADEFETFLEKNTEDLLSENVFDVKNRIYQNIYNNLTHILKSKGTIDGYRNLIHCFGANENLINLNLYAKNQEYELKDNFSFVSKPKNVLNLYTTDNFNGSVYQMTASNDSTNTKSFVSASSTPELNDFLPFTLESQIVFPRTKKQSEKGYFFNNFLTSSLFGLYPALSDQSDTTFSSPNTASLQVYAERDRLESNTTRFRLTGSVINEFPELSSSFFNDVYNGDKWNFSVSIKHNKHPYSNHVSGSLLPSEGAYVLEFYGVNTVLDNIPITGGGKREFYLTSSLTFEQGQALLRSNKRIYCGAEKTNFTGSVLNKSDVKFSNIRCWLDYIPTSSVLSHAKFYNNKGVKDLYQNLGTYNSHIEQQYIPKIDSLILEWNFTENTGSNSLGEFYVSDESSGSQLYSTSRYGEVGSMVGLQYPGKGHGFKQTSTNMFENEFLPWVQQKLPETLDSLDMISIKNQDWEVFSKESRPENHVLSFEKSMYQVISQDMLNLFETVIDFNTIIGHPVNRYRPNYKQLDKLRELYFQKVENEPDLERFFEFYKWIDSAVSKMMTQLHPATANVSNNALDVIESHILERNKYQHRFPLLITQTSTTGSLSGYSKFKYNWNKGFPTLPLNEEKNGLWWKEKSILDGTIWDSNISSDIIANRISLGSIFNEQYTRNRKTALHLSSQRQNKLKIGINFEENKRKDLFNSLEFKNNNKPLFVISGSSLVEPRGEYNTKLQDGNIHPIQKRKFEFTINSDNSLFSGSGKNYAFFNIVSSSVSGVYAGQINENLEISNLHHDFYNNEGSIQSPFTKTHVGGYQWRHISLNTGSDVRQTRPEKFGIEINNNDLEIIPSDYNDRNLPNAKWSRDGLVKRLVNIKNIQNLTSSNILGNFSENYEVIHTVGRKENNLFIRENTGSLAEYNQSTVIGDLYDYSIPRRDLTGSNSIIASRFSSPGDVQTLSIAYKDVESNEYSPYNALPWRNNIVRNSLNQLWITSSIKFGIDSNLTASYHKTYRNKLYRLENSGSSVITASVFDNNFVQHQIPRSDLNYRWINESAISGNTSLVTISTPFGFSSASYVDGKHRSIQFLSQSLFGSYYNAVKSARYYGREESVAGTTYIPNDFIGLNTNLREPVSSSENTLGFSSLVVDNLAGDLEEIRVNYINSTLSSDGNGENTENSYSLFSPGLATILNGILHHRNGVGGWHPWKQVRLNEHSVVKRHKSNNILSLYDYNQVYIENNREQVSKRPYSFTNYTESCVSMNYPLGISLDQNNKQFTIKVSYENDLNKFSNPNLSNKFKENDSVLLYNKLNKVYLDDNSDYQGEFISFSYKQRIFPKRKNVGLDKTRSRVNYAEESGFGSNGFDKLSSEIRTFWPNTIQRTSVTGSTPFRNAVSNSWGRSVYPLGNENIWYSLSESSPSGTPWNILLPKEKTGSYDGELNIHTTSSVDYLPYVNANVQGMFGTGQLFLSGANSSSSLSQVYADLPTASLQYVNLPYVGKLTEYKWPYDIPQQSGKTPWYNSYDEYSSDLKIIGKDYSIIPEFRISEHIEDFYNNGFGKNNNFLNLNGGYYSASANSTTSSYINQFFDNYTNSDFSDYFNKVYSDHKKLGIKNKNIKISCKAIKKLLPYNGFYPVNRTVQLGSLFSQSLGPYISGSDYTSKPSIALQSLLQPYFAPGILYNTIKSGIAVDWPLLTGSTNQTEIDALWTSQKGTSGSDFDAFTLYISSSRAEQYFTNTTDWGEYVLSSSFDNENLGKFHTRLPFESLIDIKNTLLSGTNVYYTSPDKILQPSGSSNTIFPYFNWKGEKKPFFEMAMHNFLSEIPEFFLKEQKLTSFRSLPEQEYKALDPDKTYYMDIVLRKTDEFDMMRSYHSASYASGASGQYQVPLSFHGQYYGPPVYKGDIPSYGASVDMDTRAYNYADPAYAPYTPPYFYGKSKIRLAFKPTEARKYTIDEIVSNALVSSSCIYPESFSDVEGVEPLYFAQANCMKVDSSINILGKSADDRDTSRGDSWVISTKFETPVLNFNNSNESVDVLDTVNNSYNAGFLGKGMWGTYGSIPTGSEGIYFSLEDSYPEVLQSNLTSSNTTGSLIDICGFEREEKKIGKLADKKIIKEAVIAIPYTLSEIENGVTVLDKNFFKILGNKDEGSSIQYMLDKVKEYNLPPFMNFNIEENNIEPFAFYLFEFSEELDKEDLSDIWQGVMPKPARKTSKQDISFKHDFSHSQMLFGHSLPSDTQWLIFKLKKRARRNYYELLPNKSRVENDITKNLDKYSYNWPYDYFSLVEMIKLEVEQEIGM